MNERLSGLSATARAFATYSLVPYLGILFCPGAVVAGSIGVIRSYRTAEIDHSGRSACLISLILGIVLLVIQILLWWILYKVPIWSGNIG